MRVPSSRSLVKLAVGALLLLTMSLLPRPARAGCSHPARPLGDLRRAGSLAGLDALITGGTPSQGALAPTRQLPRRPLPCSGPSCSGQVPLPVSSSIVTLAPADLWGVLGRCSHTGAPPVRFARVEEPRAHVCVITSSIFHPPRPSC
jgi:hypothetical protein